MRTHRVAIVALLGFLALAIHQGCGGVDYIPYNPFVDLERRTNPNLDGTLMAVDLPLESVQPDVARIGDYVLIHGRGRIFPAGFARFHFSGNSEIEVEVPRQTGTLRVQIPHGTISGAFGFVISQQSDRINRGSGNQATGPAPQSFRIGFPGIRILGPGEPPGGFPNSPYPLGPPAAPFTPPDTPGAPLSGPGTGPF